MNCYLRKTLVLVKLVLTSIDIRPIQGYRLDRLTAFTITANCHNLSREPSRPRAFMREGFRKGSHIQKMLQKEFMQRNQPESDKARLFRVFHNITNYFNIHRKLYFIILAIEIMQLISYGCHHSFLHLWPESPMGLIQQGLDYLDLSVAWRNSGGYLLLGFVSIAMTLNVLITGIIGYEMRKEPINLDEPNLVIIKILTYYFILLKTILIIPMTLAFTYSLHSNPEIGLILKIALITVSVLGLLFMGANLVLANLFFRDNSPFSKIPIGSSVHCYDELRTGMKIMLGVYGSIAQEGTLVQEYCLTFLYSAILLGWIYLLKTRPALLCSPFKLIYQLGFVLPLWTLISCFLQVTIFPDESIGFLLWIIGLLLVPLVWVNGQKKQMIDLLGSRYDSFSSGLEYLRYSFYCCDLALRRSDPNNLIILEGILCIHGETCSKPVEVCRCKQIKQRLYELNLVHQHADPTREEEEEQGLLWFEFIKTNLEKLIGNCELNTPQILYLLAYVENEVFHNKFKALHRIEEAMMKQDSLKLEMLSYHFIRRLQQKLKSQDREMNEKKSVDINKFFFFQMGFSELQDKIEESAREYACFWALLKSKKVTWQKLFIAGQKVSEGAEEIHLLFQKLMKINSNNAYCLVLYANYMKIVVNSSDLYERWKHSIELVKRSLTSSYMQLNNIESEKYGENSNSAVIVASGNLKDIGIIKHCTEKIRQICGYASHQLLGRNLNMLMPNFIGSMHDDVLRNYLELTRSEFDHVQRVVPIIDNCNYMVLARNLTKPFPNLINGLELVGIFNSIIEASVNHPGEKPKYVLYRSDTGQVQALSRSCHSDFGLKIDKIDKIHHEIREMSFREIFIGVSDQDLNEGYRVKCTVLKKNSKTSNFEAVPVQLFQRLKIYYCQVYMRLVCFYNTKNARDVDSVREVAHQLDPELVEEDNRANELSKTRNKEKILTRQKLLHGECQKQQVVGAPPLVWKILRVCGLTFLMVSLSLAVVFAYYHDDNVYISDYLQISIRNGEVIGDACELAFYGKLKHVSVFYPKYVPAYSEIVGNMNKSISTLQDNEIAVEEIFMKYGNYDDLMTKIYKYGTTKELFVLETGLNVHVFNLVTVSGALMTAPLPRYNFMLQILEEPNPTQGTSNLFATVYNTMYEMLPAQNKFEILYSAIFDDKFSSAIDSSRKGVIVGLFAIILVLAIIMKLAFSVINLAEGTLRLFGHMTHAEVTFEMKNCNSFIDVFFSDSYMTRLKKRIARPEGLQDETDFEETCFIKRWSTHKVKSIKMNETLNLDETDMELKGHSCAKLTLSRIEFMEKEVDEKTEHDIFDQTEGDLQNSLLKGELTEEQTPIYERLKQETGSCKIRITGLSIFLMLVIGIYFVLEYMIFSIETEDILNQIKNLKLAFSNVNSLKQMKLYTLQTYIDKSTFLDYPAPEELLDHTYSDLYQNQRSFDSLIEIRNSTLFDYFYHDVCLPDVISQMASSQHLKLTSPSGFTVQECSGLLDKAITRGLRFGYVAYAEELYKISKMNISETPPPSTRLMDANAAEKYMETPLTDFIFETEQTVKLLMSKRHIDIWTCVMVLGGVTVVLFIVIWFKMLGMLRGRLVRCRTILGFIPVRVLIRNRRLAEEYEHYLGDLTEEE